MYLIRAPAGIKVLPHRVSHVDLRRFCRRSGSLVQISMGNACLLCDIDPRVSSGFRRERRTETNRIRDRRDSAAISLKAPSFRVYAKRTGGFRAFANQSRVLLAWHAWQLWRQVRSLLHRIRYEAALHWTSCTLQFVIHGQTVADFFNLPLSLSLSSVTSYSCLIHPSMIPKKG